MNAARSTTNPKSTNRYPSRAFTLIELLVVVSIIALLIAILVPSLGKARNLAKTGVNLSNLRSMGQGVQFYLAENENWFFPHEGYYNPPGSFSDDFKDASLTSAFPDTDTLVSQGLIASAAVGNTGRRTHWVDYVGNYMKSPKAYLSPMLSSTELANFTTDFSLPGMYKRGVWGGYGYNFQFLGREWKSAAIPAYRAKMNSDVLIPANTIVIGDSAGSRKGAAPPGNMKNSYVLDPPLYTINAAAKIGKYYQGVDAPTSDADLAANPLGSTDWRYRCYPATRNMGKAAFVFADGHAQTMLLKDADDSNGDGVYDNGLWNGNGNTDPSSR
jgi:prepilin-type N-terminal cleavage/methylation domain-containing protein/prepilin-type processing-associated H-X9-DG protein